MSIGKFHVEEGLLLRQRGRLILQKDDGGFWVLEAEPAIGDAGSASPVEGVRCGFNGLGVVRIAAC